MTENKDVKEGITNGNVTSISVSDDIQAQTVSKVLSIQNINMSFYFKETSVHILWTRCTWVETRTKRFG